MKFKLDENLGDLGCDLLTGAGYEVSTVGMQRLSGSDDAMLYEACRVDGRVLITLDRVRCFAFRPRTWPALSFSTVAVDFHQPLSLLG